MSSLQQRVMRRIYFIWFLRRLTTPALLRVYIGIALILQFFASVSIVSVIHNATYSSDKIAIVKFLAQAFASTDLLVKGIVLALGVLTLWLIRDLMASPRSYNTNLSGLRKVS